MPPSRQLGEQEPRGLLLSHYLPCALRFACRARSFAAAAPSLARSTPSLARSTPSLARSTPSLARRPLLRDGPLGLREGPSISPEGPEGPPEGPSGPRRRRLLRGANSSSSSGGCACSSLVAVCWPCCSAPHLGQKLTSSSGSSSPQFEQNSVVSSGSSVPHLGQKAASSGTCALQFGQDSSCSCCSWVCSSVTGLFSLAPPGVPFRVGYILMGVEAKAHLPLLLARSALCCCSRRPWRWMPRGMRTSVKAQWRRKGRSSKKKY